MNLALFSRIEIHGRAYSVQDVEKKADGSTELLVSQGGSGRVYSVIVRDGVFSNLVFQY